MSHALGGCRFYTAVKHVLNVYWPAGTQGVSTADVLLQRNASSAMNSLLGVIVWLAREAFWKYRWVLKEGAKVSLDLLIFDSVGGGAEGMVANVGGGGDV